ncbi:protein phosphatase PP2A regulatory subunit A [Trichomonascus vanleenenianus]|uniref:protein phosphatase 2A structural subunit TPD3 n=1 Tax=Trichomonascus vanleenenianus TaxID=2268995 RepID=UPI003ECA3429
MEADPNRSEVIALALLVDELKNDEVTLRLNAIRRLSTIALALGPERSRSELVPFLEEVTQEDEDEVLTVLAEELGELVPYVGGPEHATVLIRPLEVLSAVEEPVVRDRAIEALNKLTDAMSPAQVEEHIVELIKRLSSTEWFSSRVSATGLYSHAVAKVSPELQTQLLAQYRQLTEDEAPMVRRAAATNLPKLVEALPEFTFEGSMSTMLQTQAFDDQDSVRLLSVDVLIAIADRLKAAGVTKHNSELISYTTVLFNDKSWRVRYMAADRFEKLAVALNSAELRDKFVTVFLQLMRDNEAEVRTAIAKQIPGFCSLISRDVILAQVVPEVEELASDSSQHVRAALATQLSRLAPLLGQEKTTESLLPVFLLMLKDSHPDVRLNIISTLQTLNEVIGIELLSKSLLPAISELAKDKQWRVRLAIIEHIPLLAEQLGVEFFDRELGSLCMTWLWDSVYSIREAATQNLRKLTQVFGAKWAREEIIPHILIVGVNANYLYRLTALFAVTTLIPVMDEETITNSILTFVLELIHDPIPNIRFNVAKSLQVLAETIHNSDSKQLISSTIRPKLESLEDDTDVDVRYFAKKSLDEIKQLV